MRLTPGLFTSTLVFGNTVFLIKIIDGRKDFLFRNEHHVSKLPGIEHLFNLFEYFQNKSVDSNNTRQNTNGSIKEQPFLRRGSKKLYSSHQEKKKGTSM